MRTFKKAYIEITNVCNLACPFCPGTARPKAFMSLGQFDAVLMALKGRVRHLYLHLMGEPLLHPELGKLLERAAEAGFPVNLTTNGRLLEQAEDVLIGSPALRQLNISLHSGASQDNYLVYVDGVIASVNRIRAARSLLISMRLWNLRNDGDNANSAVIKHIEALYSASETLQKDNRGWKLAQGLWLDEGKVFDWPSLTGRDYGEKGFCQGLRDQIGILCDGTVTPCCLDGEGALALGNLFSQSLEEIISSPRAATIYDGFSRRQVVEELCRRCGYRQRFDK